MSIRTLGFLCLLASLPFSACNSCTPPEVDCETDADCSPGFCFEGTCHTEGQDGVLAVVYGPSEERAGASAPPPVPSPAAPASPDGTTLGWPEAPLLTNVSIVTNRDSVLILLPEVEGAQDFRAFVLRAGIELDTTDGLERVENATLYCAGFQQHNDVYAEERELIRAVEVSGISEGDTVVVEAISRACPFPGILGSEDRDVEGINSQLVPEDLVTQKFVSAESMTEMYGSVVINGHRPSTTLAQAGDDVTPRVLARTAFTFAPTTATPTTTFFDGFESTDDPFAFIENVPDLGRSQRGKHFQNEKWDVYSYGAEHTDMFVFDGKLHMGLADWAQDIFATNVMYPRRPAALDDELYLHVTFEISSSATARRYWWFFLCGSEVPGDTFTEDLALNGNIIQTPFFYQPDGRNPSVENWNCFQIFTRDGWPGELDPDGSRPETDLRVMVNLANQDERDSVVNVSPAQFEFGNVPNGWYRQQDENGNLIGQMLDDQMRLAPNAKFDIYIRRDRVIFYVNDEERVCNDFAEVPLSMAEAAVGFGQVLYHSAAERYEFDRSFNDTTGQRYFLENTPYADERRWDNVGYDELVEAPSSFTGERCFAYSE